MAVKTTTKEESEKITKKPRPRWFRFFQFEELGILSALLVICLLLTIFTENFTNPLNLIQVVRQASYIGIMAVGMVFVLSQGDVDLSVGALFNLVAMIMARLLTMGVSVNIIMPIGLLVGALLGLINGMLSVVLNLPMIIITLGTISIYSGLSLVISGSTSIASFPKDNWFFQIFGGKVFGFFPMSVLLMIGVAIVGYVLYYHTSFGRRVAATGANRQAARYAGINVNRTRMLTMAMMGTICAIGSIGVLGFLKAADPSIGKGSELDVISATIIGGTSLFGGSGSIPGAIIGALIIAVIRNGLVLMGVSVYWQGVVTGSVIIIAVTLDYIIKRIRK